MSWWLCNRLLKSNWYHSWMFQVLTFYPEQIGWLKLTLEEDFSCSSWSVLLLSMTEKPLEQVLPLCLSPSCSRTGIVPARERSGKKRQGYLGWSEIPVEILFKFSSTGLDNFTLSSWKRLQERLLLTPEEDRLSFLETCPSTVDIGY